MDEAFDLTALRLTTIVFLSRVDEVSEIEKVQPDDTSHGAL